MIIPNTGQFAYATFGWWIQILNRNCLKEPYVIRNFAKIEKDPPPLATWSSPLYGTYDLV